MIYELITESNINKALEIQRIIFPEESAKWCYELSLSNHDYKYYLVYYNNTIIGVTGLYTKNHFKDNSIWIGWYGILPQYRNKSKNDFYWNDRYIGLKKEYMLINI